MNLKIKLKRYALLLLFSPSIFASGSIASLEKDLANFHAKSGSGYAAIITLDGKSQYQDAVGKANIELDVALNIAHKFEIGSLTKQFTAVAILHLAQSGKLKLTDNISQFISGISTTPHPVTIEHLLAHTSGLVDPINEPEFLATRVQENIPLESLIDMFKNNHWQTKAGERANYSNLGYSMLAKIIEEISGLSYFEYLDQHFLKPLGMNNTQQFSFAICSNKSAGYTYEGKTLRNKDYLDISWAYGAADLISNTKDLATWTHALMQGQILKPEYLKILTSPITLNNGEVTNGSYTFSLEKIQNFEAIRMSGSTFGYSSHSIYLPQLKIYVLVLSNTDGIHQGLWIPPATVTAKLLASYLQLETPSFEPVAITEQQLQLYIGKYLLNANTTRQLPVENGQLFYQHNQGPKFPLTYMGDNRFYFSESLNHFEIMFEGESQASMHFYYFLNDQPEIALRRP